MRAALSWLSLWGLSRGLSHFNVNGIQVRGSKRQANAVESALGLLEAYSPTARRRVEHHATYVVAMRENAFDPMTRTIYLNIDDVSDSFTVALSLLYNASWPESGARVPWIVRWLNARSYRIETSRKAMQNVKAFAEWYFREGMPEEYREELDAWMELAIQESGRSGFGRLLRRFRKL